MMNIEDIPYGYAWASLAVVLFGLVLPLLITRSVVTILASLKPKQDAGVKLSFIKQLLIGWALLIPLYLLSAHYFSP